MNAQVRIRWLVLIFLLEAALFIALQSTRLLTQVRIPRHLAKELAGPSGPSVILQKFSFENQASLKSWEEKIFKGRTHYQVLHENNESFLNTSSQNASSGLYTRISTEVSPDLFLSWKWRAISFPQKKEPQQLSNRKEDDFAARVYVIFPASNFFKSDVIEYVWDKNLPSGTVASSPFSERVKLFVIQSGLPSQENSGWREEERNIYEDYRRLFGKEAARAAGVIALMSDSDNTGTESEADFGTILLKTRYKIA